MKSFLIKFGALPVLILGTVLNVSAQVPATGNPTAMMNAAILRLFGNNTNFIAKLDVHIFDRNQHETGSAAMNFERLGDRVRYDVNMAQIKSRELSPQFAATMKDMAMDQMIAVRLPDKKSILSIYPGLKAYAEVAMDKDEIQAVANRPKIEKTRLGRETIDGHVCDKNDVTITEANGHVDRVIVWNATDMKEFPVQMQIPADDTTLVFKFKDVKLGRPELSHFDAPQNMKRYTDVSAMMSDAITRKLNSSPAK